MWCCCETSEELEIQAPVVADQVLPETASRGGEAAGAGSASTEAKPVAKEVVFEQPRKAATFTVELHRNPSSSFGVDVSAAGKVCLVNSVIDGTLVSEWNEKIGKSGEDDKDRRIRPYDRLMSFNEKKNLKGKEMMDMLRSASGPVTLIVQRPSFQRVVLFKRDQELGITVIHGPTFLLISNITDGVFQTHNARAAPKDVINIPSRIVSVDGRRGNSQLLLKLMEDAESSFEVELLRYD
ncbi:PDZ domain-containing protein [Durusdinium trenchii]|uniref:PDZ domain-containing protein n=1 Tax=Durusdinium trenchii TaxID=1381693 RepID=A0ABP0HBF5_9DINO